MIFKKNVLSVAVAGVLAGTAGVALAALAPAPQGTGHMLMVPYFSTQSGNSTMLNIVNTDTVNGKAVKVRFRSAKDSDDIFDFQVFLSPGDVWTASIAQTADGISKLTTDDASCTIPAKGTTTNPPTLNTVTFATTRLAGTDAEKKAQTLEGYVEIFNMADIPVPRLGVGPFPAAYASMTAEQKAATLYHQVKHVAKVAPCNATVLEAIEAKGQAATVGANDGRGWRNTGGKLAATVTGGAADTSLDQDEINAAAEIDIPTGGLMANWTIINVPNTTTFTGDAVAVRAGGTTRVVYSRQTSDPVVALPGVTFIVPSGVGSEASSIALSSDFPNIAATFDAVLHTFGFATAEYDFPDMSTPLENGNFLAGTQAFELSTTIATTALSNEYLLDSFLGAKTDWLVSMPTRRYLVAGRGTTNQGVAASTTGTYASGTIFGVASSEINNNVLAVNAPVGNNNLNDISFTTLGGSSVKNGPQGYFDGVTTYAADGRSSCVTIGGYAVRDREESLSNASTVTTSPATVTPVQLCGEVNILSMAGETSNTGAIKASQVVAAMTVPYGNGWARISLNPANPIGGVTKTTGLPAIGYAFIKATNPSVSAGVSGTFGGAWQHRY